MKKRILCVLLTLIMLIGLVPMTASAATNATSAAAITVLKQLTTFKGTCEHYSGSEFRTGYGTVCEEKHYFTSNGVVDATKADKNKHTITQDQADTALRTYLKKLDEKVNAFATNNGLSLTQNQHDALVVFTHGVGDSWMSGTGILKNVIVSGGSTEELLNAMMLWGNEGRRKVEANMYVNGVYSNTIPSNFVSVTYDANTGSLAQGSPYTMYYDTTESVGNIPVPTKEYGKFLGWYTAATGGTWVPSGLKQNSTLYALFQPTAIEPNVAIETQLPAVNYKLTKSQLASLTMYDTPSVKGTNKGTVDDKTNLTAIRDYIDSDGARWSMLSNKYWVKVGTPTSVTTEGVEVDFEVTVTVTNSYVNRRVNASAFSAKNGSYSKGDQLLIIREDGGWGQVAVKSTEGVVEAVGWVSLMYTNWDSVSDGVIVNSSANNTTPIATAVVTYNGYLNIRSEAGTDNKIVGALAKSTTVNLYEIKTVNGHQWGRTDAGWICLTYTKVTMKDGAVVSDTGVKAYTFSGKANNTCSPRVAPGSGNDFADYDLNQGTSVTITNLAVADGSTWGKVTWYVDTNEDGKTDTATTGWALLSNVSARTNESQVTIDPAKFVVASDKLNVRDGAGDGNNLLFTLDKGTEVEVSQIYLVGENIWGYMAVNYAVNNVGEAKQNGYINLASKYVTRSDLVTSGAEQTITETGLVATVINTDSLKVRTTGATYGSQIGTLSRGTTVAVWEVGDGWYKVDSNKNGVYDYEGDGWVSGSYLNVYEGSTSGEQTVTNIAGETYTTDGTGMGVVANTYSGVNVRTGAGTGNAATGKLLPGTTVEILEVKTAGASKWGRTAQGWVCMDYITMITYNEVVNSNIPEGGIAVDSYDDAQRTSTTAVYTGHTTTQKSIFAEPNLEAEEIRVTTADENITIHELAAVTERVESTSNGADKTTTTTVTTTTYWARVNDGWIYLPSGSKHIVLDALDEKIHTLTGAETLNIRKGPSTSTDSMGKLKKGDQVAVTELVIENDKVWGRIETENGAGYIRLDYMSEGAIYLNQTTTTTTTTVTNSATNNVTMGNTSSVGGYVTNTSGYRYTGKVIRTNSLNVRSTPSETASKTTTLKSGQAMVIYETSTVNGMAWGRCDAGWVYLYYVDLTPVTGAVDARVVAGDNTVIYTDMNCSAVAGTYAKQAVIDIFEIVGKMARTDLGWVSTDNLL